VCSNGPMGSARTWVDFALILTLSTGCGGCVRHVDSPVAQDGDKGQPAGPTPAAAHAIRLDGEPALEYRTRDTSSTRFAKAVKRGFPSLKVDPCPERAAAAHLQLPDSMLDGQFPLAFTEFTLHWAGCPDPSGTVTTLLTRETGFQVFAGRLREMAVASEYTHVGVAVEKAAPPYEERWIGLLVNRRIHVNPVPTAQEPGSSIALQFRLESTFDGAVIAVTPPRGQVQITEQSLSSGWVVSAISLGDEVGEYWIELIGHDSEGPQVLALFPVQVGRPPPRVWVGAPVVDESWIDTVEEAEQAAASLVDQDRLRFGLPPLIWDEDLAAVARSHSRDMSENDYFAHVSPTTGTMVERLRRAEYPASFAAENIAMAPRLSEAQASLMRSPGHRAAILTTDATHFGVGVVTSSTQRHGRVHHLTQVFARREPAPAAVGSW